MRSSFCEARLIIHKSSSLLLDDDAAAAAGGGCDKRTDESSAGSCSTLLDHTHSLPWQRDEPEYIDLAKLQNVECNRQTAELNPNHNPLPFPYIYP